MKPGIISSGPDPVYETKAPPLMPSEQVREEILKGIEQKAMKYLEISGNCAQASFLALQEEFRLEGGSVLKVLTPFPGLAHRGGICGTVVGCITALGLVFGREDVEDWDGYVRAIPQVRAFYRRFQKAEGSFMCLEVVESLFGERFEGTEPAETNRFLIAGAVEKCGEPVRKGVRIAAEIILDRRK